MNAVYISKNPNEAQTFMDYSFVSMGKLSIHAKDFFGNDIDKVDNGKIIEAEKNYKLYKDKFKEFICKKCSKTRTRISWSTLDLLSMAKKVNMEKLYLPCYFLPTMEMHSTFLSISSRMEINKDKTIHFNQNLQHMWAERSLLAAHSVLLYVIATQNDHFHLNLDDEVKARDKDFHALWSR